MALEALSSTELLNFIIYDTISATPTPPYSTISSSLESISSVVDNASSFLLDHTMKPPPPPTPPLHHHQDHGHQAEAAAAQAGDGGPFNFGSSANSSSSTVMMMRRNSTRQSSSTTISSSLGVVQSGGCGGAAAAAVRKKRRRRPRVCKNKEEAETQRMTHITVERNRRKQMNEHLAVLRSLMPDSYVQRGDQASIVGGAIEFVKELEHLLQSLEAQKLQILHRGGGGGANEDTATGAAAAAELMQPPFAQFFMYPQYTWSQIPNKYTSKSKAAIADIEVTLIETHASLRILSRRCLRQLSKLVAGFHALQLTILHLSVTTLDPLVLYSVSVKVEEGCQLSSVDDIAGAVHHMLRIIEEEAQAQAALC